MRHKLLPLAALAALLVPAAAHAASFDVETATRAWLDTLQGPARAKSDAYFEGGYWLTLWGTLISVLIDGLLLRFALSARFRDLGERVFKAKAGVTWITALCYSLAGTLLTLPWSIYVHFVREQQYDLMNQTFGDWLFDLVKDAGIDLVIFPLVAMAVYAVIRCFSKNWWLLATGVIVGFLAFGMLIGPVYIAPLFNTYTELPAGPVRDRIVAMAQAKQIPSEHIYLFDA